MAKKKDKRELAAQKVDDMPQEWSDMLEAVGQKAGTCTIHRKNKRGRDSFLETVPVEAVTPDPYPYIKEHFGGGDYRLFMRDREGGFLKNTTMDLTIDGPEVPWDDPKEKKTDDSGDGSNVVLAMMHEAAEDRRQERADAASRPGPIETATALVAALAPILAPLMERREPPPVTAPPTMLEQVETMGAMMGLAKQMSGDGDGFSGLVKTMAEPIAKLVNAHVEGQPGLPNPNRPEAPAVSRPSWYPIFEPVLPALVGWARAQKDPVFRAEFVLDELADDQLGAVYQFITGEGFAAEFFQHVPEAAAHQEWFGRFFDTMIAGIVFEPQAEVGTLEPARGDAEPETDPAPAGFEPGVDAEPASAVLESTETGSGPVKLHEAETLSGEEPAG